MSQLPNAPLIELVFRIRWHVRNPKELSNIQYLLGDFYNQIKDKYPKRSRVNDNELPFELHFDRTSHQFSQEHINYPNIQLGANMMTLTCTDEYYHWEEFRGWTVEALTKLIGILRELINPHHYHLYLDYFDFYPLDFNENNVVEFLSDKMKIKFSQGFHQTENLPRDFDLSFEYQVDSGLLSTSINMGKYNTREGVIVKIGSESNTIGPNIEKINEWLDIAHNLCSETFKTMTEGELYASFQ